jgi:hypothetical protein
MPSLAHRSRNAHLEWLDETVSKEDVGEDPESAVISNRDVHRPYYGDVRLIGRVLDGHGTPVHRPSTFIARPFNGDGTGTQTDVLR